LSTRRINMNEKPVLIQGAMQIEVELLIENLTEAEKVIINGYEFYKGKIKDVSVVISRTKVGMVNASVATILGINTFNPKCIINQGVAGGHDGNVHKGDIVIGEFVSNMNAYKTANLKKGEGSCFESWKLMTFNEGNNIEKEKIVGDITLVNTFYTFLKDNFNVHKGTIVSGDGWNKEYDRIAWYISELNSLAEDMETYSVYKICRDNNVPVLGVRMISNSEINEESYDRELGKKLQENIIKMIVDKVF